jgi:hypothetical protein
MLPLRVEAMQQAKGKIVTVYTPMQKINTPLMVHALGITYNFYKTFTISGNVNYNAIKGNSTPDLFVTGFNTPKFTTNISFGNRAITKNIGFNIVWKWQDSFLWESPIGDWYCRSDKQY